MVPLKFFCKIHHHYYSRNILGKFLLQKAMVIIFCCLHSWDWCICWFCWFLLLWVEDCQWVKSTNADRFLGWSHCCSVHHLSFQLLLVRVSIFLCFIWKYKQKQYLFTHSRLPKGETWSVFLKRFVWYALFAPAIIIGKESYFILVHIQT